MRHNDVTLLDLVSAVGEYARSEAELIATVVYMGEPGPRPTLRNPQGRPMTLGADISAPVPPCRQRRQRRLAMSALGIEGD